ncbi:MAG: SH3 domain-containing protein [Lachnospiraceae bacterium]
MKKKILIYLLCLCMLVIFFPSIEGRAEQEGPDVLADGYCVVDNTTGTILMERNMNEQYYPASITKIMNLLVVAEQCNNWYQTLTYSQELIDSLEGTRSSLMSPAGAVGEKMTVKDAVYGMILCSGNECAGALARFIAGSEEAFADLMNAKAEEIGAKNTHFVTPHGLHDKNHYTTPYDMYLIVTAAMENPIASRVLSTVNYVIKQTNIYAERYITMSHSMINGLDEEVDTMGAYAGKTGRTPQAGRTLVTLAKGDGYDVTVVIMKSDDFNFYTDTAILIDYAIEILEGRIFEKIEYEESYPVWATGTVNLRTYPSARSGVLGYIPKDMQVECIGEYGDWSIVKTKSGKTAYTLSSYLTKEMPEEATE